jgi:hypothetical protein
VLTAVPAAGLADWLAVVPEPLAAPAFWFAFVGLPLFVVVPEFPGAPVTRVSLLAAVPPCGFTDCDALVFAGC